jgi:hypothetical protein
VSESVSGSESKSVCVWMSESGSSLSQSCMCVIEEEAELDWIIFAEPKNSRERWIMEINMASFITRCILLLFL